MDVKERVPAGMMLRRIGQRQSIDKTGRVEADVREAERLDDAVTAAIRGPEVHKNHLVFVVVDSSLRIDSNSVRSVVERSHSRIENWRWVPKFRHVWKTRRNRLSLAIS